MPNLRPARGAREQTPPTLQESDASSVVLTPQVTHAKEVVHRSLPAIREDAELHLMAPCSPTLHRPS